MHSFRTASANEGARGLLAHIFQTSDAWPRVYKRCIIKVLPERQGACLLAENDGF